MKVFNKTNTGLHADALFKEASGLECLRQLICDTENPYLSIPKVYSVTELKLVIEKILSRPPSKTQMKELGMGLAMMHSIEYDFFGYEEDNYIGASPQANIITDNWGQFFCELRLEYQLSMINDKKVHRELADAFNSIKGKLKDFLNQYCQSASLLHGDLWSGNVLFDSEKVWLIDPAVYIGDREADIAMTEMFGGFTTEFYRAYDDILPRSPVYPTKKVIYNLYHYLNHYNLFGSSYLPSCRQAFELLKSL